ncbi:MAG: hypothetical protein HY913_11020 [Desulfomonile tiedjei]|nr:hypothetical protein [Desulfomonile tiedjei]
MNPRSLIIPLAICSLVLILAAGPAYPDRTLYLNVCQELVNQARSYEARASFHNSVSKGYQMQIENMSKQPKNQGTISAMDSLFSQYDQNRLLEIKFRELYRQTSEEAERCMKRVD